MDKTDYMKIKCFRSVQEIMDKLDRKQTDQEKIRAIIKIDEGISRIYKEHLQITKIETQQKNEKNTSKHSTKVKPQN